MKHTLGALITTFVLMAGASVTHADAQISEEEILKAARDRYSDVNFATNTGAGISSVPVNRPEYPSDAQSFRYWNGRRLRNVEQEQKYYSDFFKEALGR